MKLRPILHIFAIIAIVLTLIPFIAVDYWWIRIFDFPHIQLTILTFTALVVYFMRFRINQPRDYIFVVALAACFVYQVLKIYPYTALAPLEVMDATEVSEERKISLYTANVLQKNEKKQALIDDILEKAPDLILLLETNTEWMRTVSQKLPREYAHKVEIPLDNTYGMLLYSKLPLINPEAFYMVKEDIPSIRSKVVLRTGDTIQLFTLHPTPPMPQHNPKSSDRDAEMMKTANLSRESHYPVIVLGDLNDVAWSNTTKLFQNVGELLDLRKGRGFYNTFNAKNALMRWPLDHIFVSEEFRVVKFGLGASIHSDHYPAFAVLNFEPEGAAEQRPPRPSDAQLKDAKEQASGVQEVIIDF
ncbi:MAG: endonuclease [Flavobacteriaceae bacterium]|nr:endonuclease [Flavobacteriaceae bacterium]